MAAKIAVVTGAGSGIGAAIAGALALDGARVGVLDINSQSCAGTVERIANADGQAMALEADVSNRGSVDGAIQSLVDRWGTVDILVNNAGHAEYCEFAQLEEHVWDRMIGVHLKGTFNCSRSVINGMIAKGWGRVLNMSSVAALTGTPLHTHYSAAKGGIVGLTKALAREVAANGVTVNSIAPGFIDTPMTQGERFPPEIVEFVKSRTPVPRSGTPEEVASLARFLVSDDAGFITGQVVSINGGYVI